MQAGLKISTSYLYNCIVDHVRCYYPLFITDSGWEGKIFNGGFLFCCFLWPGLMLNNPCDFCLRDVIAGLRHRTYLIWCHADSLCSRKPSQGQKGLECLLGWAILWLLNPSSVVICVVSGFWSSEIFIPPGMFLLGPILLMRLGTIHHCKHGPPI